jgi:hypothetical protein
MDWGSLVQRICARQGWLSNALFVPAEASSGGFPSPEWRAAMWLAIMILPASAPFPGKRPIGIQTGRRKIMDTETEKRKLLAENPFTPWDKLCQLAENERQVHAEVAEVLRQKER